jgi:tetratricopeptide (TPR) repeat protein
MRRLVRIACALAALAAMVGAARMIEPVAEAKATVGIAYLPTSECARMTALGYRELASDLYWFKAVQYYGGYRLDQNDIELFAHLADLITDLDPQFTGAYRLSAIVITEDLGNFAEAKRLMEKGLRNNPDDYWLTFEMGFLHYMGGRDYTEAEKYFRLAAAIPNNDGSRAARFAAEAASKGGNIEASIVLWRELAESSDSEYLRELAERYIARLEKQRAAQGGGS